MVCDTPPSQDASTQQIWNSYLKEYRRYGPDTKAGRTDGRTVRLLYASQSSFGVIKMVFNTDYRLMQVESIAECSKGSILQYFRPSLSYHFPLRPLLSPRFFKRASGILQSPPSVRLSVRHAISS